MKKHKNIGSTSIQEGWIIFLFSVLKYFEFFDFSKIVMDTKSSQFSN